jgi:hypothetical protein
MLEGRITRPSVLGSSAMITAAEAKKPMMIVMGKVMFKFSTMYSTFTKEPMKNDNRVKARARIKKQAVVIEGVEVFILFRFVC